MSASFDAQLERRVERETKGGKPFYEIYLVDGTGEMKLKVWDNCPQFRALEEIADGTLVAFQWGLDTKPIWG